MFCAREGQGRPGLVKKMRTADLTDITLAVLVSPVVWLLVTRAPVLATILFSSVLITG
jgi:hypothetical protein